MFPEPVPNVLPVPVWPAPGVVPVVLAPVCPIEPVVPVVLLVVPPIVPLVPDWPIVPAPVAVPVPVWPLPVVPPPVVCAVAVSAANKSDVVRILYMHISSSAWRLTDGAAIARQHVPAHICTGTCLLLFSSLGDDAACRRYKDEIEELRRKILVESAS
jgi:hypothetical protein